MITPMKPKGQEVSFEQLLAAFNELAKDNQALVTFMVHQCGIIYTAVTNDVRCTEPLKEISIMYQNAANSDLIYFHNTLRTFITAIQFGKTAVQALEDWRSSITE